MGSKLIGSEFRGSQEMLVLFTLFVLDSVYAGKVTAQPQYVQNRPSAAMGFAQQEQATVRVQCSKS